MKRRIVSRHLAFVVGVAVFSASGARAAESEPPFAPVCEELLTEIDVEEICKTKVDPPNYDPPMPKYPKRCGSSYKVPKKIDFVVDYYIAWDEWARDEAELVRRLDAEKDLPGVRKHKVVKGIGEYAVQHEATSKQFVFPTLQVQQDRWMVTLTSSYVGKESPACSATELEGLAKRIVERLKSGPSSP